MEHFEYFYLLMCAHEIKKLSERAAKENEEFFPSNRFTKLKNGLEAQAIIRPLELKQPDVLILRLRHIEDGIFRTETIRRTQHVFFNEKYMLVPSVLKSQGWCEYIAYSDIIPEMPTTK